MNIMLVSVTERTREILFGFVPARKGPGSIQSPPSRASEMRKRRMGRHAAQSATCPYAAASSRTRWGSDFRLLENMHRGAP
jgi:hypothetical protein